jgi:POT family proton-dependent oligopeptide transporter
MSTASAPRNDRWPPQIKFIVGNEACERFSYYGMKGILAGYMTGAILKGGLNMSDDRATTIFHLFVFANYFTPLLGAWLSDKLFGRYGTILWVSLFYCAGHGVLAMSDWFPTVEAKFNLLCIGLTLIAFGAGGIKPCVSAFMGDQFKPDQDHLMQKAYGAFYFSINFGSFFSFIVIPRLRELYGYGVAFGVPGILMGLATIIFWLGRKKYERVKPTGDPDWPKKLLWMAGCAVGGAVIWYLYAKTSIPNIRLTAAIAILGLLALAIFTVRLHRRVDSSREKLDASAYTVWWYGLTSPIVGKTGSLWDAATQRFTPKSLDHGISMGRILSVFALIPVFWALFDQSNSTWVLQGNKMVPVTLTGFWKDAFGWFFGDAINAENMQSTNPALVMILVPFLTLGVYQWLGRHVTPLRRMGCGMFIAAFSYVIVAWLQQRIEAGEQISVAWQAVPYVFLTTGEVLISATGLEFAFTQAAPEMKSTIMSFWLLTVAAGNALVSLITSVLSSEAGGHSGAVSSGRFLLYAGMTAVVGVLFVFIAMRYRYRDTAPASPPAAS